MVELVYSQCISVWNAEEPQQAGTRCCWMFYLNTQTDILIMVDVICKLH